MHVVDLIQRGLLQRFAAGRLNKTERDQVTILLRRFVRGEMDDADSTVVIEALTENEQGMALLASLWRQQPAGMPLIDVPDLDMDVAYRIQSRLEGQIQQAGLARALLKMGTNGFFSAALGLIRPFAHRNKKLLPRRKRSNR